MTAGPGESRCRLAVFPKCFLGALLPPRTMTWMQWIELAAGLPHVEGVEGWPPGFDSFDTSYLGTIRAAATRRGLTCPMMCASPDFTHRDESHRTREIEREKEIISATARLGGSYCRILSGQRRPGVSRGEGIEWVVEAIEHLLPHAESEGIVLVLENHYKDGLWEYPEFAQESSVFLEIVGRIESPWFGVNYDPSNALISGDDPVWLLEQVLDRVVSMHASDRTLQGGTIEDLRRLDADATLGYAAYIQHGIVGQGLVDYDAIFRLLASRRFRGWISIEDGQDAGHGLEHLARSASFLHYKMREHGLAAVDGC